MDAHPYNSNEQSPSAIIRDEILTVIADALMNPSNFGDTFFVQLVHKTFTSNDGFMPITLLCGMVQALKNVPEEYIKYCAEKEPDRLQLNGDRSKVRLPWFMPAQEDRETDPYGRTVGHSDDHNSEASTNTCESTPAQKSTYFRPYKPRYAHRKADLHNDSDGNSMHDEQDCSNVMPVYFKDGKFYADTKLPAPTSFAVPQYDKVDMEPIGAVAKPSMEGCWNCGAADHSLTDCPEPRDKERIQAARQAYLAKGPPRMGRFFVELEMRNRIASLAPGVLSEELQKALGLRDSFDIPPYYIRMREHGYPPGYWGTKWGEDPLKGESQSRREKAAASRWYEQVFFGDYPLLKVYDDVNDIDQDSHESNQTQSSPAQVKKVKLVHYPGLHINALDNFAERIHSNNRQQSRITEPPVHSASFYYTPEHYYTPEQHYAPGQYSAQAYPYHTDYAQTYPAGPAQPAPQSTSNNAEETSDADMDISDSE